MIQSQKLTAAIIFKLFVLGCEHSVRMVDLFNYYETQWIRKVPPYEWSMHRVKIRTNNAAKGFHNRLNIRAMKGNIKIFNYYINYKN